MCHQQSADVYINGVLAVTSPGPSSSYVVFPMTAESAAALHPGQNVLAVHVSQDFGGRFADAGLVEVEWPDSEKTGQ
jgi:hypothetical protein